MPTIFTPPARIGGRIIGGTSGSVLFVDSSLNFAQNNANFFWDNTNNRLGIGTISPTQLLDVRGIGTFSGGLGINTAPDIVGFGGVQLSLLNAAGTQSVLELAGTETIDNTVGQVSFINRGGAVTNRLAEIIVKRAGANNTGTFDIQTDIAGTRASKLFIDTSGNVGIGTTLPGTLLHVAGAARITGALQAGADIAAAAYARIGSGTTSQGLSGTNELFVSGKLEVDGAAFMDSTLGLAGTITSTALFIINKTGSHITHQSSAVERFDQGIATFTASTANYYSFKSQAGIELGTNGDNRRLIIETGGTLNPGGNKTLDFGSTATRWNNAFYVAATTGTSRLAQSNTTCNKCLKPMMRGTGTIITLGENADFIPVFCPDCGTRATEAINHLPVDKLLERKPAPKIEFLGMKIHQYSGHSRGIQVMFKYQDIPLIENSTYLSDFEFDKYKIMTETERKIYLLQLGQREWDAMEETRLMKEICENTQKEIDGLNTNFVNKNLLIYEFI